MPEGKIKVIHMAPLGSGGISKLTVTINEMLPPDIQFDYLVFRDQKEFFEDRALALGGKKQVIDVSATKNDFARFLMKMRKMTKLFRNEKYDVVHVDASLPYDVIVAIAAKLAGIKTIVMHSHNDDFENKKFLRDMLIPIYKILMRIVVTDYFAISEKSAEFMFPKSVYKQKKYTIVRNGINSKDYVFKESVREAVRTELNIEDKIVVGHVGRFVYQKNHDFILEAFKAFHDLHKDSVLLLVGEGTLMEKIKEKAKRMEIADSTIFFGTTYDIPKILHAMDLFIFPSRFEGLGIVAVESQANGVPTVCANTIVDEVNITDCFFKIDDWNKENWANKMYEIYLDNPRYKDSREQIVEAGYDIEETVNQLVSFYRKTTML